MTKKFICVQGSPEIPKGSMVEKNGLSYALYIQGVRYSTLKGTPVNLEPWQVEGNECWEEVIDVRGKNWKICNGRVVDVAHKKDKRFIGYKEGEARKKLEESILEEVKEETKEEDKPTRWKPKVGEKHWFIDSYGIIHAGHWEETKWHEMIWSIGNSFRTEQEARDELKRRESIANAWRPKEGEEFYYWSFEGNHAQKAMIPTKFHHASMCIGAVHPTEEACQRWGKTYAKYFLPKTE